jgi:hypothetical protein
LVLLVQGGGDPRDMWFTCRPEKKYAKKNDDIFEANKPVAVI